MGLSTYAELKASLTSWFHNRTDVADIADDLIDMAEARFNREVKSRKMDVSTTLTITTGVATIPTGLVALHSLVNTAQPYGRIDYAPIDVIEALDPSNTGAPCRFAEVGEQFITWPPTSATARIRYRAKLTPLDSTNTTNWLLTDHPDLYLKTALLQASEYFVDDDRIPLWEREVATMIERINRQDREQNASIIRPLPQATTVV